MGNDGGSIPRRVELVREKQRPKQADKDAEAAARWKHCQLSQQPLRQPVVACDLGRLYNKDAILQQLLAKKSRSPLADHIKSLKDVYELKLTVSADSAEGEHGGSYDKCLWVCPVTGLEMNGRHPFSFLRSCGCVLSDRALKALKSDTCPGCNSPNKYTGDEVIPLNPPAEEVERLREAMNVRRAERKASREGKKRPLEGNSQEATTSKTARTSSSVKHPSARDADVQRIAQRSVATDPAASQVFKSLFTSSEDAKKRDHAHWVTYNPFYN
ncbi:replication termination factor 2-like [Paramacrobiotus metropolitanus]|uniref:replication termination factor 2-like n=1 Tax=Paramacrobiotus metropolitanus TaxID=2943436 RepID=UPI002445C8B7|nr:replication termination factor 2-like [Paramacrobiotus metropolitanus]